MQSDASLCSSDIKSVIESSYLPKECSSSHHLPDVPIQKLHLVGNEVDFDKPDQQSIENLQDPSLIVQNENKLSTEEVVIDKESKSHKSLTKNDKEESKQKSDQDNSDKQISDTDFEEQQIENTAEINMHQVANEISLPDSDIAEVLMPETAVIDDEIDEPVTSGIQLPETTTDVQIPSVPVDENTTIPEVLKDIKNCINNVTKPEKQDSKMVIEEKSKSIKVDEDISKLMSLKKFKAIY